MASKIEINKLKNPCGITWTEIPQYDQSGTLLQLRKSGKNIDKLGCAKLI